MNVNSSSSSSAIQALANQAKSNYKNGDAFEFTLPTGPDGSAEKLSGRFQFNAIEPAGDNSLFTPGDTGAGKQAFSDALDSFLLLAQQSSQQGTGGTSTHATYTTSTSFASGNEAMNFSGDFSLDAMPAK